MSQANFSVTTPGFLISPAQDTFLDCKKNYVALISVSPEFLVSLAQAIVLI